MQLFIWKYTSDLTDRYHSGGGCAIIAESLEDARKYFLLHTNYEYKDTCGLLTEDPHYVAEIKETENKLFIFPDAGCC